MCPKTPACLIFNKVRTNVRELTVGWVLSILSNPLHISNVFFPLHVPNCIMNKIEFWEFYLVWNYFYTRKIILSVTVHFQIHTAYKYSLSLLNLERKVNFYTKTLYIFLYLLFIFALEVSLYSKLSWNSLFSMYLNQATKTVSVIYVCVFVCIMCMYICKYMWIYVDIYHKVRKISILFQSSLFLVNIWNIL